jgi:hypothetical protein
MSSFLELGKGSNMRKEGKYEVLDKVTGRK